MYLGQGSLINNRNIGTVSSSPVNLKELHQCCNATQKTLKRAIIVPEEKLLTLLPLTQALICIFKNEHAMSIFSQQPLFVGTKHV